MGQRVGCRPGASQGRPTNAGGYSVRSLPNVPKAMHSRAAFSFSSFLSYSLHGGLALQLERTQGDEKTEAAASESALRRNERKNERTALAQDDCPWNCPCLHAFRGDLGPTLSSKLNALRLHATRRYSFFLLEVLAGAISWRFKSSRPHQIFRNK